MSCGELSRHDVLTGATGWPDLSSADQIQHVLTRSVTHRQDLCCAALKEPQTWWCHWWWSSSCAAATPSCQAPRAAHNHVVPPLLGSRWWRSHRALTPSTTHHSPSRCPALAPPLSSLMLQCWLQKRCAEMSLGLRNTMSLALLFTHRAMTTVDHRWITLDDCGPAKSAYGLMAHIRWRGESGEPGQSWHGLIGLDIVRPKAEFKPIMTGIFYLISGFPFPVTVLA
jgi:hypothetical protein